MELVTPKDIRLRFDVSEDGASYLDNAKKKADAGRRLSGLPTLADDSGLEVPLLGGRPGVQSAYFAGRDHYGDGPALVRALLAALGDAASSSPPASFHCVAVLALPDGRIFEGEGVLTGRIDGRTQEIQRLIGRALRAAINMPLMGERTIMVDCDVLQADGGTRTASITGGFVALHLALQKAVERNLLRVVPIKHFVSAVSVGIVQGQPRLDLNYLEDFAAQTDMNCVLAEDGRFIEIQGTAEQEPFKPEEMEQMLKLAVKGAAELVDAQKKALKLH